MDKDEIIAETITAHDQMLKRLWCIAYEEGQKAEREACAKVCKKKFGKFSESKDDWLRGFANGAYDCEVAIRNRGAK